MANYSVWMLEQGNITISDGGSLSGISQGDGSHLVGHTLRLDSADWLQTFIRDNDTTFDDNDGTQRLDGAQTIAGVSHGDGTRVEAEYRLTVRDPDSGDTWDVLGYNVNDAGQSPAYGTVEGLVFVGEFPPVGVDLEVVEAFEGPGDFGQAPIEADALAAFPGGPISPPCFTPGTRILTDRGYVPVEDLKVGDGVRTRDAGVQRLAWVGEVALSAADLRDRPAFHPVRIGANALGEGRPARSMLVSPQHRILVRNAMAELHFGISEVLIAAQHLIDGDRIARAPQHNGVRYLHIMCDAHHIIWADGLETETFLPGPQTIGAVPQATRDELLALFPQLRQPDRTAFDPARPMVRAWEARMILSADRTGPQPMR